MRIYAIRRFNTPTGGNPHPDLHPYLCPPLPKVILLTQHSDLLLWATWRLGYGTAHSVYLSYLTSGGHTHAWSPLKYSSIVCPACRNNFHPLSRLQFSNSPPVYSSCPSIVLLKSWCQFYRLHLHQHGARKSSAVRCHAYRFLHSVTMEASAPRLADLAGKVMTTFEMRFHRNFWYSRSGYEMELMAVLILLSTLMRRVCRVNESCHVPMAVANAECHYRLTLQWTGLYSSSSALICWCAYACELWVVSSTVRSMIWYMARDEVVYQVKGERIYINYPFQMSFRGWHSKIRKCKWHSGDTWWNLHVYFENLPARNSPLGIERGWVSYKHFGVEVPEKIVSLKTEFILQFEWRMTL